MIFINDVVFALNLVWNQELFNEDFICINLLWVIREKVQQYTGLRYNEMWVVIQWS